MKISCEIGTLGYLLDDVSDKARLEIIKMIILTAPNAQEFYDKTMLEINSLKFKESID